LRAGLIGLDGAIKLESLGVTLSFSEIYRLVKSPEIEADAIEQAA
jgi:hypothetical protein